MIVGGWGKASDCRWLGKGQCLSVVGERPVIVSGRGKAGQ